MPHLEVQVLAGRDLAPKDSNGLSDPFCKLYFESTQGKEDKTTSKKTPIIKKTLNPKWNSTFVMKPLDKHQYLVIQCWDKDPLKKDFMGEIVFELETLKEGCNSDWFTLQQKRTAKKVENISGDLQLEFRFFDEDHPSAPPTPSRSAQERKDEGIDSLDIHVVEGRNLGPKNASGTQGVYCKLFLQDDRGQKIKDSRKKTSAKKGINPDWSSVIPMEILPRAQVLVIQCYLKGLPNDDFLGEISITLKGLIGEPIEGWMPLHPRASRKHRDEVQGELFISVCSSQSAQPSPVISSLKRGDSQADDAPDSADSAWKPVRIVDNQRSKREEQIRERLSVLKEQQSLNSSRTVQENTPVVPEPVEPESPPAVEVAEEKVKEVQENVKEVVQENVDAVKEVLETKTDSHSDRAPPAEAEAPVVENRDPAPSTPEPTQTKPKKESAPVVASSSPAPVVSKKPFPTYVVSGLSVLVVILAIYYLFL